MAPTSYCVDGSRPDALADVASNPDAADVGSGMMAMLQEMTLLLAKIRAPGSFATRRTSTADDLRLDVKGVGRIGLPIAPATARRLRALARPARPGFKDQTRLDHRIRDTWEIAKSRISIDQPRWRETFRPQLDRIRRDLGLPQVSSSSRIRTPRRRTTFGTLAVILPSDFTGGAMVIEHHDEKVIFSSRTSPRT